MSAIYEAYKVLPKKLTAAHVGSSFKAKIEDIKLVFNVRGIKNVNDVHNDLIPSIEAVGIQQELTINLKGELIDGHRRLSAAKELDLDVVPVIIKDVAREEISLYQVANANRKNLSASEIAFAIQDYYEQNPKVALTEIEEKFKVSRQAVYEALKLQRISPELADLVNDGLLSKGAAEKIIASNIGGKPQDVTDLEKRKIQEVVDILIPNIERDKEAKEAENVPFKPWSLRDVNKLFPGENQFKNKEEADDKKKSFTDGKLLKALVAGFVSNQTQELQDGSLLVELTISKEVYEALLTLQESQAKIKYLKAELPEDNEQILAIIKDLQSSEGIITAVNSGSSYLVEAGIVELHPKLAVTNINGEIKRTTLAELKKLVRNGIPVQIVQQESKAQKDSSVVYSKNDVDILNAVDQLEDLEVSKVNPIANNEIIGLTDDIASNKILTIADDDEDEDMFTAMESFESDDEEYDEEEEI